ncbi:NTP transferase domain-containing protein, partial [Caldimonas tepidiphila]|uniref:NTP transferase domain-containing protein n=1 Tax=Caldimonas tepidiphila TaxID=2315841 RepID=UPI00196B7157
MIPTPPDPVPVAALLLAAGRSRRFGADKRAAPVGGRPMLEASLVLWRAALPAAVPLTVVLRDDDGDALAERVRALGAQPLRAAGSARGLGASLAAGALAQPAGSALLVGLADMPFVRAATIARVAARLAAGAGLVAPFHAGR